MEEPDLALRKIIDSIVSNICINTGFSKTEIFALETLSEMFVAYIYQLLIQTKLFAELQNRTEPSLHDLASAFFELGVDLKSFHKYIRSIYSEKFPIRIAIPPISTIPKPAPILHAIKPKPHLNYINDHFPSFPDPHTYILTECSIKNEREYQRTRELIADQKINIERGLVKFKVRNQLTTYGSKQLSIFNEDTSDTTFMTIKNDQENSDVPAYLTGLMANLQ